MNRQKASPRRILRRSTAADQKRALAKAILHLPADLRDVFLLHRMAGLSFEEIGQQLGIERTVVQAYLAEALALLVRAAPAENNLCQRRLAVGPVFLFGTFGQQGELELAGYAQASRSSDRRQMSQLSISRSFSTPVGGY
ncbi:sigma-70 region 4 domain-containing protein [Brevundimonas diminuta]|uniref:RNA polymerase sigma factor n=1 Tax=Brevundimonas diminuta TaxID=293 RepID=UPI0030F65B1A